jgi:uncharacterized protein
MRKILIFLFVFLLLKAVAGQINPQADLLLISGRTKNSNSGFSNYSGEGNSANALGFKRKSVFARYNPISLTLTGSMLFYQHIISPQLSAGCIYSITCSNYAKHCIEKKGIVRGVLLGSDRLLRCNGAALKETHELFYNQDGKILDFPEKYGK